MDERAAPGAGDTEAHDRAARRPPAPTEALAEAAGHLQTAALSMVAAVRAALDAVEQLAKDPGPLLGLLAEATRASGGPAAEPEPPQRPRVEHIAVIPQQGPAGDDRSGGGSSTRAQSDDEGADRRDLG